MTEAPEDPTVRACANCGTALSDRFCSRCGQKDARRLVSLTDLVRDVLEDQFSLEARLPRTLLALFGRPGKLTADYANGRVARYIPPFRLFVVSGLLFFLAVSFVASFGTLWQPFEGFVDDLTGHAVEGAEVVIVNVPVDTLRVPGPLMPLARHFVRQQDQLNALPSREAARVVYGGTLSHVSAVTLLLVPVLGLLFKGLYPRRLYVLHVIFILHVHSAFYLAALLPLLVRSQIVAVPFVAWMAVYLYLALRRVYGDSHLATGARWLILFLLYNVALVLVLVAVLILTVLTFQA